MFFGVIGLLVNTVVFASLAILAVFQFIHFIEDHAKSARKLIKAFLLVFHESNIQISIYCLFKQVQVGVCTLIFLFPGDISRKFLILPLLSTLSYLPALNDYPFVPLNSPRFIVPTGIFSLTYTFFRAFTFKLFTSNLLLFF